MLRSRAAVASRLFNISESGMMHLRSPRGPLRRRIQDFGSLALYRSQRMPDPLSDLVRTPSIHANRSLRPIGGCRGPLGRPVYWRWRLRAQSGLGIPRIVPHALVRLAWVFLAFVPPPNRLVICRAPCAGLAVIAVVTHHGPAISAWRLMNAHVLGRLARSTAGYCFHTLFCCNPCTTRDPPDFRDLPSLFPQLSRHFVSLPKFHTISPHYKIVQTILLILLTSIFHSSYIRDVRWHNGCT